MSDLDKLVALHATDPDAAAAAFRRHVEEQSRRGGHAILGEVVRLMLASKLHRGWPLRLIELYVLPALHHQQFRLYRDETRAIGYVSWAWLSQTVEDRYLAGGYQLTLQDWKSGDLPWIVDFVVPYGHIKQVRMSMRRERVFGGRAPKAIRPPKAGEKGQVVMQFGTLEGRRASPWRTRVINRGPRPGST